MYLSIGLLIFAALIAAGAIWSVKARDEKIVGFQGKKFLLFFLIGLAALILFSGLRVIPIGYVGVVFNQVTGGLRAVTPGTKYVIPIVETLTTYHVRIEEYTMSATPGEGVKAMIDDSIMVLTKDGQDATWDVTIRYQAGPEPYRVVELHRTIGPNYREIIVRPMVREALRTVAKEFEAMESFAAAREEIARMAEERIGADFEQKCLRLDKVLIRKIELPPALADAIRAKKVAEQKALEMEYVLDRERKEAERKVIEAKGRGDAQVAEAERRAKAIRVLQEELAQSPEYIKYLAVEKLADDVTVILLPEHAEAIIPLESLGKR